MPIFALMKNAFGIIQTQIILHVMCIIHITLTTNHHRSWKRFPFHIFVINLMTATGISRNM